MSTEQEKKPATSDCSLKLENVNKRPVDKDGNPLKPCCACPETKQPRDACIIEKGEANCQDLIEAHKKCMRDLGFKV